MVGVRNEQLTFLAVHIVADADQQPWSCRGRLLSKEPNFTDKPNTMTSRAVGDAATSHVLYESFWVFVLVFGPSPLRSLAKTAQWQITLIRSSVDSYC